jgi:predicted MFS family arabinose efflux permease
VVEVSASIDATYGANLNSDLKNEYAMLAMVALGVGEMLGGQLIGQVIDQRGSRAACLGNCAIMLILAAFTLAFLLVN